MKKQISGREVADKFRRKYVLQEGSNDQKISKLANLAKSNGFTAFNVTDKDPYIKYEKIGFRFGDTEVKFGYEGNDELNIYDEGPYGDSSEAVDSTHLKSSYWKNLKRLNKKFE
tara:strand:- start:410 stop:751 length:342 start_codon:yes stop_codon:yes gene_type:complete